MHEMILCKLGEVVLKGLNRRSFEMKLMSNLRRRTARFGRFRVYSKQSTIYVEPAGETCDLDGAYDACKRVFGIIAVARALPCAKEKEAILDTAKTYLGGALTAARSFKVESKRADKTFPMTSIQLSQWVGGHLHEAFPHLTVDVHHPELTVYVEVREEAAYVHAPAEPAAGGQPLVILAAHAEQFKHRPFHFIAHNNTLPMVFVASLSCSSIYVPGRGPSRPPHSGSPSAAREYRSMADAVSRFSCRRPAGKCSRCAAGPPPHQHCPQPLPPAFQKRPAGTGRSLPCSGADAADGGPPRTTGRQALKCWRSPRAR